MKNKTLVRILSILGVCVVLLGCAVPVFASNSVSNTQWRTAIPFTTAVVKYSGYDNYYAIPLDPSVNVGVGYVNTSNAPYSLGSYSVIGATTAYATTVTQYANVKLSQRVIDTYYSTPGATEITLLANNVMMTYTALLTTVQWQSYAGTLTVTATWYTYNESSNTYVSQSKTTTRTLSPSSGMASVNLFDGFAFQSGNAYNTIIQSVSVRFVPTTSGVTCNITGMPVLTSSNISGVLNSNAGSVIYDTDIPSDAYDLFGWLVEPIEGFLGLEIVPGVSLGGILFVGVAVSVVLILLKVFGGG